MTLEDSGRIMLCYVKVIHIKQITNQKFIKTNVPDIDLRYKRTSEVIQIPIKLYKKDTPRGPTRLLEVQ